MARLPPELLLQLADFLDLDTLVSFLAALRCVDLDGGRWLASAPIVPRRVIQVTLRVRDRASPDSGRFFCN
jgi:hypothetical protein